MNVRLGDSRLRGKAVAQPKVKAAFSRVTVRPKCSQNSQTAWNTLLSTSGTVAASMILGGSLLIQPASAAGALTKLQQAEAQEMAEIVRQRTGQDLPVLRAAPTIQVAETPSLMSRYRSPIREAVEPSNNFQAQLDQLQQELDREKSRNRELSSEKEQVARQLEQASATASAAESRLQSASTVSASTVSASTAPSEVDQSQARRGNVLGNLGKAGIAVAGVFGGLGGFFFSNRNAQKLKAELEGVLAEERSTVESLRQRSAELAESYEREQALVARLKKEMTEAAASSSKLLDLERTEKESAQRQTRLTQQQLDVEKKLVESMKREAAAARELIEAERAAKFAIEAESREVARKLAEAEALLYNERELSKRVGEDVMKARAEIRDREQQLNAAKNLNDKLKGSLETETSRAEAAETKVAQLRQELDELQQASAQAMQKMEMEKGAVTTELTGMRAYAEKLLAEARASADKASREKQALEKSLEGVNSELGKEQQRSLQAATEMKAVLTQLADTQKRSQALENLLAEARMANSGLSQEVGLLQAQVEETRQRLSKEESASRTLRNNVAGLQQELTGVKEQLSSTAHSLEGEKARSAELVEAVEAIKSEYLKTGEALEMEQGKSAGLLRDMAVLQEGLVRAQAEEAALKKQLAQSNANSTALKAQLGSAQRRTAELEEADSAKTGELARLQELQAQLTRDLQDRELMVKQIEARFRAELDEASQALTKSQQQVAVVRAEAITAQRQMEALKQQLAQESAAKTTVEGNLASLKKSLETVNTYNEEERKKNETSLNALRTEFEMLKTAKRARKEAGTGTTVLSTKKPQQQQQQQQPPAAAPSAAAPLDVVAREIEEAAVEAKVPAVAARSAAKSSSRVRRAEKVIPAAVSTAEAVSMIAGEEQPAPVPIKPKRTRKASAKAKPAAVAEAATEA